MEILNLALEGMHRAEQSLEKTAARIARLPLTVDAPPQDQVDLSAEAIALLEARNAFAANARAARVD
ncbi:MAG: flagellar protein [Acidobacteria bacterium]|nr:flagellar protein [Acidobacteriota bacterium]